MNRRRFLLNLSALPAVNIVGGLAHHISPTKSLADADLDPINTASMWIYLWDLVDEGYEFVLRRLQENGITSISLACAYHGGKFLLPHNPKRKVIFVEDGSVYFHPNPKLYGAITPRVSSLVREGHNLKKTMEHAHNAGVEVRAWVVCCHNTALGMEYPGAACQTVFGDKLYHNLCPSNPDVRTYIRALVKDIASHGVPVVELEALGFQPYTHGFHHEREGIEINNAIRFLLGICFCDSCVRRASGARGEIDSVRQFTKFTLESYFENPHTSAERYADISSLPNEIFDPFFQWRSSVITSFVEELAEEVKNTNVQLRPLVSIDPSLRTQLGIDAARIALLTGGILVPAYARDGSALLQSLSLIQSLVGENEIIVGVQVGLPGSGGKKEFRERVRTAREMGISRFNFYNYGFIPYESLGWIKESVTG